MLAATIPGSGRKSCASVNTRTTSKPRSAICAISSRTSTMSNSRHMYMALLRGQ